MRKLVLLIACASLAAACGSSNAPANPATSPTASSAANTNANASRSPLNENAYSTASNSSLGLLMEDVGKTASQVNLWQNKEIDTRLSRLMGADYAKMKNHWHTETPIKRFGDFLMMTGCERPNCDNQYVIFMDKSEGNINVVHIYKGDSRVWKEYGEIGLPPPFAEQLAAMKSDK